MSRMKPSILAMAALVALGGCATQPLGPTVSVMPAPNKPFQVFQDDQAVCKDYAGRDVAGGAEAANQQAVGAAILGTALGAAIGASTGRGRNTTVGAVTGAAVGTAVGASMSQRKQYTLQERYDIAYSQCMYARGNQVPGFAPADAPPPPPPPPR